MKKAVWLSAVLAAVLVVAGAAVWMTRSHETPAVVQPETTPTETVYSIVGEWEGRVAVFAAGADTPQTVYDTWVRTLPETEQEKLKTGIPVRDREELLRLLEDYAE